MDIFVVDDELLIASTTAEILRMSGYSAIAFTNPDDALAAVSLGCPRLVIADLKMPGLSGLDLAIRIRESCAGCGIILFTGLVKCLREHVQPVMPRLPLPAGTIPVPPGVCRSHDFFD
jgi:DNA-binding response OmpR family regulator